MGVVYIQYTRNYDRTEDMLNEPRRGCGRGGSMIAPKVLVK